MQPNLFVGPEFRHYKSFVARHEAEDGKESWYGSSKLDGRAGLWVPLSWHDNPQRAFKSGAASAGASARSGAASVAASRPAAPERKKDEADVPGPGPGTSAIADEDESAFF